MGSRAHRRLPLRKFAGDTPCPPFSFIAAAAVDECLGNGVDMRTARRRCRAGGAADQSPR